MLKLYSRGYDNMIYDPLSALDTAQYLSCRTETLPPAAMMSAPKSVEYIRLSERCGVKVSNLCLGCATFNSEQPSAWRLSGTPGTSSDEAYTILDRYEDVAFLPCPLSLSFSRHINTNTHINTYIDTHEHTYELPSSKITYF